MSSLENLSPRELLPLREEMLTSHVIDSWILALVYGMHVNSGAVLDQLAVINNLQSLVNYSGLQHLLTTSDPQPEIVKEHLVRLTENGFLEHDPLSDVYTLTGNGYMAGKIKFASLKKRAVTA